jgi:hypothetical protein
MGPGQASDPSTAAGKAIAALLHRDYEKWRIWFSVARDDRPVRPNLLLRLVFSDLARQRFAIDGYEEQIKDFIIKPCVPPDSETFSHLHQKALLRSEFEGERLLGGLEAPFMRIRMRYSVLILEDLGMTRGDADAMIRRHERALSS